MKELGIVSWSGGKDCALALYEIINAGRFEALKLLTTINIDFDRISFHGVRSILLEKQSDLLGIPFEKMLVPKGIKDTEYEKRLSKVLKTNRNKGFSTVIFGDIFLEDVREYRERLLSKIGVEGLFPLWKRNTLELAHSFIHKGFKAIVTVVDSNSLGEEFAGREFDKAFLSDLPNGVDPCGENGEFHSFVYDGPIFREKVTFVKGEIILRENRFYYCDLIPNQNDYP